MSGLGPCPCKDEETHRIATDKTLAVAKKRIKDLGTKLTEADRERKSAEAALAGAKKQVEDQRQQLCKAVEQLAFAHEQIETQKKELEKKEEAFAQVEQTSYDTGVKEQRTL